MTRAKKILATLVVLGAAGSVAAFGVFAAFSATTENTGNTITAGTVAISDNDSGATLYNITNASPGVVTSKCIEVTYGGSLDAAVKLYTDSTLAAGAQYVNVVITPGTQVTPSFPSCTGFVADGDDTAFSGTLQAFKAAHSGWANGFVANPGTASEWLEDDTLVYKVDVSIADNPLASGATSGTHKLIWESQNN